MLTQKLPSISITIVLILFTLITVLVFSCSEQPTGTQQESGGGGLSGSGEIDPGAGGSFLLGSVSDSTFAPGYIEVWAMDVAYDTLAGIVSFDVELLNRTERDIHPPVNFVITDIIPSNIAVLEFDGVSGDGFPFYDFSTKLGDDNVLTPDERTQRVTMKFHTVEPRSFAIGFRIDLEPSSGRGIIAGVVYRDDNENGVRDCDDLCEPGVPEITVALEKTLENNEKVMLLTRTDSNGEYKFFGLEEGVYPVFVKSAQEYWKVTSTNPLLVTLVQRPDGVVQDFLEANFGVLTMKGLLLWNKLGSAQEVQNSEVGPDGIIVGDVQYVACQHGNGMKPMVRTGDRNIPDNYVDFHTLNLGNKGCIEFWYLPDWIDGSVGHVVNIFQYGVENDPTKHCFIAAAFNDWQNLMGISVRKADQTASVGMDVRPATIPGWSTTEPFHVAFTWDGTAPVITDRLKFFVNGQKIGSCSHSGEPALDDWPPNAVLRLGNRLLAGDWDRHHWEGHNSLFDNIKIWNYAKTDFSDRFTE